MSLIYFDENNRKNICILFLTWFFLCYSRSGGSLNCLVVEADGGCYEAMPPAHAMRLLDSPQSAVPPADRASCDPTEDKASVTSAELALLAKLEEANRLIESDAKSLNSLSGNSASGHSRKSSDTSQISLTSGNRQFINLTELVEFPSWMRA